LHFDASRRIPGNMTKGHRVSVRVATDRGEAFRESLKSTSMGETMSITQAMEVFVHAGVTKRLIYFLAVAPVILAGCSKLESSDDSPAPPVQAQTSPAPAIPNPTIAPRVAAPGIWYLTHRVSFTTADGIFGADAGTQVAASGSTGQYTWQGQTLSLSATDVTNDLDLAARLTAQNAAAQAALYNSMAASTPSASSAAPAAVAKLAPAIAASAPIARAQAAAPAPAATATPQPFDNPLGTGPYDKQSSVVTHYDAQGRPYHLGVFGQRIYQ